MTTPVNSSRLATPSKLMKPSVLPRPTPGSGRSTPSRAMSRESLVGGSKPEKPDDWIVGDRCFVNGVKSGKIAFLGETRFADGEWAGIVLDEPTGKNDGSVNGVRYFQCPSKRGVFCRMNKLTRQLTTADSTSSVTHKNDVGSNIQPLLPTYPSSTDDASSDLLTPNLEQVQAEDKFASPEDVPRLKVGDRVIISGNKRGFLRYLGATDFKDGVWAGVELEQPLGKNDGSVEGKRYFICKPRYGLFAPADKVVLAGVPATPVLPSMTASYRSLTGSRASLADSPTTRRLPPAPRQTLTSTMRIQRASQSRTGSQESLCSMTSVQSASSSNRKRADGERSGSVGPNASVLGSPVYATLQESLKEKEKHLDQLMRERDIERAEMARNAQLAEQVQQELTDTKAEAHRQMGDLQLKIDHLHEMLVASEKENKHMMELYEEEKKKCEDYQFRIEEESIIRTDLEGQLSALESQVVSSAKEGNGTANDAELALGLKNRELEEVRRQNDTQKNRIEELERLAEEARRTEADLRSSLLQQDTTMDAMLKEKETQIDTLERELTFAKEAAQEECSEGEEIKRQQVAANETIARLRQELSQTQQKLEPMIKTLAEKTEQLSASQSEQTTLAEKLKTSIQSEKERSDLIEQKNEQIKLVTEQSETLATEIAALKKQNAEMKEKLSKDLAAKDQSAAATNAEMENLRSNMQKLTMEFESEKSKHQISADNLSQSEKARAELEEKVSALEQTVENNKALLSSLDEFKRRVQDLEQQSTVLTSAKNSLAQENELLKNQLKENQSLNEQLTLRNNELTQAVATNKELSSELLSLKQSFEQVQTENIRLKRETDEAKSAQKLAADESSRRLMEEKEKLAIEIVGLNDELRKVQLQLQVYDTSKSDWASEKTTLTQQLNEAMLRHAEHQDRNEKLAEMVQSLNATNESLTGAERENNQKLNNLTSENRLLTEKLAAIEASAKSEAGDLLTQLTQEKGTVTELQNQLKSLQMAQQQWGEEKTKEQGAVAALTRQLEDLRAKSESHQSSWKQEKQGCDEEISRLKQQLAEMGLFKTEVERLTHELDALKAEASSSTNEAKSECDLLKKQLELLTKTEQDLRKEIDTFQIRERELASVKTSESHNYECQIKLLQDEISSLNSKDNERIASLELLELENRQLVAKHAETEKKLSQLMSSSKQVDAGGDGSKETLEGQVQFLSSIIADQQRKMDELKLKNEVLLHSGNASMGIGNGLPRVPAPRIYCDICDIFDAHETEDCPKQASTTEEDESHSHWHGKRGEERPYCDNCECFGHATESCHTEDHETF